MLRRAYYKIFFPVDSGQPRGMPLPKEMHCLRFSKKNPDNATKPHLATTKDFSVFPPKVRNNNQKTG